MSVYSLSGLFPDGAASEIVVTSKMNHKQESSALSSFATFHIGGNSALGISPQATAAPRV